jgi:hypothetical protein
MPRTYGKKASEKVERSMHEMKSGRLRSGGSGKKVTNPKQAIAIGLSEARRAGGKVPDEPTSSSKSRTKSTSRASAGGGAKRRASSSSKKNGGAPTSRSSNARAKSSSRRGSKS